MADSGVFEHKGGFILDENGKIRYWEADPSGWYFWNDDVDGIRRLYGPFDTREDAEFHQEVQNS